jgi:hypothetical protein
VWEGRGGPPFFLKVRRRSGLSAASAGAAAAAAEVWQELLQQNWRVELDAGLGGAAREHEALLLVCGAGGVSQLLAAAGAEPPAAPTPGSLAVLEVTGSQAGQPADWRQLPKWVRFVAGAEALVREVGAGRNITAAVGQGAAAPSR